MDAGKHPNLHLLLENRVSRVLFDDSKRAIGVEYEPSKSHQPSISLSKTPIYQVYANKLVVVSAGALGTPSILERSGVGDAKVLNKLGIDVKSDLPDVGEHYQGTYPHSPLTKRTNTTRPPPSSLSLQNNPSTRTNKRRPPQWPHRLCQSRSIKR